MKISVKTDRADQCKYEGLVVGVYEGELNSGGFADLDKAMGGRLAKAAKAGGFTGKERQILTTESFGQVPARRLVLAGLGKRDHVTPEKARYASAQAALAMKAAHVSGIATTMASMEAGDAGAKDLAKAAVEGTRLALYTFTAHKKEKDKTKLTELCLLVQDKKQLSAAKAGASLGDAVAQAAMFARDLINTPANYATPKYLGDQAAAMSKKLGIKCTVHGRRAIQKMKMGGLIGVSKGSVEEPKFIVMEYMKGPKSKKPIVMVGKGLTFDTGGISLKPALNMHEMKSDMSGGAATIATLMAAASLKLKVNLVGLVPATENMPSGAANKPGDVLTGLSGVTMEVLNTDAEGRLILADALAYADRYKPDCTVDFATLTGACVVALGAHCSGLFGNDDELVNQLRNAGRASGERLWPLPLFREYEEDIKSLVADIANIGPRGGGASTAAAFLKKHVKGKWAHVDIAGTAFTDKHKAYIRKGATGVGVRLMIDFIMKRAGVE